MKKLLFAFALLTLATPGLWAAAHDETEQVNQTLKLQPGGTLRLKSFSGRVNITAADGNEVVIHAVRRASRDRLDHIKLDIHGDGSTVYIEANKRDSWWPANNNVVETDFDIKVPRRSKIDVNVFSAPVTTDGVEGSSQIGGCSASIRLEDETGSVKAHTCSGPVEIRAKGWKEGQDVDIDTFSGNVTLRVPDSARGMVSFNSFSGH